MSSLELGREAHGSRGDWGILRGGFGDGFASLHRNTDFRNALESTARFQRSEHVVVLVGAVVGESFEARRYELLLRRNSAAPLTLETCHFLGVRFGGGW